MNIRRWLLPLLLCVAPAHAQGKLPAEKPTPGVPYLGMHLHRADAGTRWPAVGFGSWRLWDAGVAWPDLEPARGRWEFARLDRYVAMARLAGVEILLPLGLSPAWASARPQERSSYAPGNAAEPRDMADWRNYVRTVAQRYQGRIRDFEIWNEPNEAGFFTGSPQKLVELTCAAYAELKAVSGDNRLVSPAMIGAGREPQLLEDFLRLGGSRCIDRVGYHFYVPKGAPEATLPLVMRVREAMKRGGAENLPLWNTEAGWWIENADGTSETAADRRWYRVSAKESAAYVARALLVGRAAGLERYFWYAWDNTSLGLIEPSSGAPKPGAVAFGTVARWLGQGDVAGCDAQAGRWSCRLKAPSGALAGYLVWSSTPSAAAFRLPAGEAVVSVERLDGSVQRLDGQLAQRQWLPAAEPVLLRVVKP